MHRCFPTQSLLSFLHLAAVQDCIADIPAAAVSLLTVTPKQTDCCNSCYIQQGRRTDSAQALLHQGVATDSTAAAHTCPVYLCLERPVHGSFLSMRSCEPCEHVLQFPPLPYSISGGRLSKRHLGCLCLLPRQALQEQGLHPHSTGSGGGVGVSEGRGGGWVVEGNMRDAGLGTGSLSPCWLTVQEK